MGSGLTYFSNKEIACPVCGSKFKREELQLGGGRLNAGELTDELHRQYLTTQKYGDVFPLIYPITVCPNCLFSAEKDDFLVVPQKNIPKLKEYAEVRAKYLINVFGAVPDFFVERDLTTGFSSYLLSLSCYPFFDPKRQAPSVKMGIFALRAVWILNDLNKQEEKSDYQELINIFYRKALFYFDLALDLQTKGEPLDGCKWLGPDVDVNFGFDGVLYVDAMLKYKTIQFIEDPIEKVSVYDTAKKIVSRVFGSGRKAKDKPGPLLAIARDLYDKMGVEMEELKSSLDQLEEQPEEKEE